MQVSKGNGKASRACCHGYRRGDVPNFFSLFVVFMAKEGLPDATCLFYPSLSLSRSIPAWLSILLLSVFLLLSFSLAASSLPSPLYLFSTVCRSHPPALSFSLHLFQTYPPPCLPPCPPSLPFPHPLFLISTGVCWMPCGCPQSEAPKPSPSLSRTAELSSQDSLPPTAT